MDSYIIFDLFWFLFVVLRRKYFFNYCTEEEEAPNILYWGRIYFTFSMFTIPVFILDFGYYLYYLIINSKGGWDCPPLYAIPRPALYF